MNQEKYTSIRFWEGLLKINEIELDFEPRNKIVPHLPDGDRAKELADKLGSHKISMTAFESAFIKVNYLNLKISEEIKNHSKNI